MKNIWKLNVQQYETNKQPTNIRSAITEKKMYAYDLRHFFTAFLVLEILKCLKILKNFHNFYNSFHNMYYYFHSFYYHFHYI